MVPSLLPVACAVAVVVVIPGPNAVAVVTSAMRDRRAGVRTALGVSSGDMVWAVTALVGLGTVLAGVRPLFVAVRWLGAGYLLLFAVRLYLAGDRHAADDAPGRLADRPFVRGLLVDLANPKAAVFFTSLFASLLPSGMSLRLGLAAMVVTGTIVFAWYLVLALALSRPAPQRAYRRSARLVNRVAAGIVAPLGIRLALSG